MTQPETRSPLRFATDAALFALGVAALASWPWLDRWPEALPFWWRRLGPVLAAGAAAGWLEAGAVRRTGRRRWLGAWLPAVCGMLAFALAHEVWWQRHYGPGAPDTGLARGLLILGFLLGAPLFALLVHGVAALLLRLRGN